MSVVVAIESPLQDDVRVLIEALNAVLMPLSPPEYCFAMTVEEMARPDTQVFVGRDGPGNAVACGALRIHNGGIGEVKRMFTVPEARGMRAGAAVLAAIEVRANEQGLGVLMLETGPRADLPSAHRLYERSGFTPRGAFLDYPDSPYSEFYEKALAQRSEKELLS
ncbi:GNAT family N-acetyltransferase [Pelagibacterium montanilacus]|uniref:GNAT family N-acetyltransferase n=1 Tax=Pelagibacterium montanilacus TaxID=2185280 RepID=UPI000F8D837C|nr:GNAT family N-acetyltransferase [Pelagibacterium montanilacus]